jgi:carbon-monoxide dehydrogenase small subunit
LGQYKLQLTVNGRPVTLEVPATRRLLDLLRDDLGLKGSKEGCGEGDCGACTVLLNGRPVNSCLVLALQAEGAEVVTIEGVGGEDGLHPLQQAFIDAGAVQCGYCTPGMVLAAKALLDVNPDPTPDQIRAALAGNLCRCTGYQKQVAAVSAAAERLRSGGESHER